MSLKNRFKAESTFQLVIIFVVFSLAGTSILFVKKPVYHFLGIPQDITLWFKIPFAIFMYYILLLFWGTVLGQFRYFWEKEKKLAKFLMRPFLGKSSKPRVASAEWEGEETSSRSGP